MTTGFSRRTALGLMAAAAAGSAFAPAFAEGVAGRKFVFVILRGGLDGLATLIPQESETEALRGAILPAENERLTLGNGFALHPALGGLKTLYETGEAAFIHAAATAYRERSHFDGQDILETLGRTPERDGWLNRALQASGGQGLAVGHAVPLALKGEASATNWSPPVFAPASDDLLARLADLYADDPVFAEPLATARAMPAGKLDMSMRGGGPVAQYGMALEAAGKLMAEPGGPGVGMVSLDGWDTHANQSGQMNTRLAALDAGLGKLKAALGPHWGQTVVVLASEFGRTAAANGTRGTDHGTGGLVMLLGGAVAGGEIHGDWPGLAPRALHEGRDLAPANDMAEILKGVLRDHLGIERAALDRDVLPGACRPLDGLVRSA